MCFVCFMKPGPFQILPDFCFNLCKVILWRKKRGKNRISPCCQNIIGVLVIFENFVLFKKGSFVCLLLAIYVHLYKCQHLLHWLFRLFVECCHVVSVDTYCCVCDRDGSRGVSVELTKTNAWRSACWVHPATQPETVPPTTRTRSESPTAALFPVFFSPGLAAVTWRSAEI